MSCWKAAVLLVCGRHLAFADSSEKKEDFTQEQCGVVVKKVQQSGKYNEESIVTRCQDEMHSPKCDFFAEALSLASSHADFSADHFCNNMDEAHFCSNTMDKLLMSTPVADLAYGECLRAKPTKGEAYCNKFEKMLSVGVQNEDLDTMRACYMIEAYSNVDEKGTPQPTQDSPQVRIVSTGGKDLDDLGKGKAITTTTTTTTTTTIPVVNDIVLQPKPLETLGAGSGKGKTAPTTTPAPTTTAPAPAPAPAAAKEKAPAKSKKIIVAPIPADEQKPSALQKKSVLVAAEAPTTVANNSGQHEVPKSVANSSKPTQATPQQPVATDKAKSEPPAKKSSAPSSVLSIAAKSNQKPAQANTTLGVTAPTAPASAKKAAATTAATAPAQAIPTAQNQSAPAKPAMEAARPPSPEKAVAAPVVAASKNATLVQNASKLSSAAEHVPANATEKSAAKPGSNKTAGLLTKEASHIVHKEAPLMPLGGTEASKLQQKPAAKRARAGLAVAGTKVKKVVNKRKTEVKVEKKEEKKDEKSSEYSGFLSKFVT